MRAALGAQKSWPAHRNIPPARTRILVFRPRSHLERAATGEKLYSKPTAKNATIN